MASILKWQQFGTTRTLHRAGYFSQSGQPGREGHDESCGPKSYFGWAPGILCSEGRKSQTVSLHCRTSHSLISHVQTEVFHNGACKQKLKDWSDWSKIKLYFNQIFMFRRKLPSTFPTASRQWSTVLEENKEERHLVMSLSGQRQLLPPKYLNSGGSGPIWQTISFSAEKKDRIQRLKSLWHHTQECETLHIYLYLYI